MQVYTGLSPKKHLKKQNLGECQMKTVFSSYSVVVVMTRNSRAAREKKSQQQQSS
jgi:hypothetical protein